MSIRRAWLILVTGCLVACAHGGSGIVTPKVGTPKWRPALRPGEELGIDVSAHNGTVAWSKVRGDGIEFAYLKASEGGDFTDDQFSANWSAAGEAGIKRGAYHYFTLCRRGAEQARHFLEVAPPRSGADVLAPAVDLEIVGNCAERPTPAEVDRQVQDFLRIVERAWGTQVVLYVGSDWTDVYPRQVSLDRPQWVRQMHRRPASTGWSLWQAHATARVRGIAGSVDLDVQRS